MPAPRKYPDELRKRAIRPALDIEEKTFAPQVRLPPDGSLSGVSPLVLVQ
jgi:hypothetical protein